MSEVPNGWATVRVKDLCELQNGRAFKQPELLDAGKYPVLRVGNFFSNRGWYHSNLELDPQKYCEYGDLLYAWSASFGPQIWDGGKVIFHYHIWRVDLIEQVINKRFLFRWFEWDKENIKAELGTGSTMIHVTKGDMEERRLALPPHAEQRRIVAKLDALTARTARARAELDRVPTLAARYKQAVLAAAFGGELTASWRLENRVPFAWSPTRVGDLTDDIRYGTAAKCRYSPNETPVLRIPNVSGGRIDTTDLKHATFHKTELRKLTLRAGDLLVIRSNGSLGLVGRTAVVTPEVTGFLFAGYLIRLRLDERAVLPGFLNLAFAEPSIRSEVEDFAKSTSGVNNINSEQLKSLSIPVPTLAEQAEIVRRIDHAFAEIDRLAAEAAAARRLLDRLDQAILAKAFRGELVSQDPADEPASALLARIRAERNAQPAQRRGRRARAA